MAQLQYQDIVYIFSLLSYKDVVKSKQLCKDATKRIFEPTVALRRTYTHLYSSLKAIEEAIDQNDEHTVEHWVSLMPAPPPKEDKKSTKGDADEHKDEDEDSDDYYEEDDYYREREPEDVPETDISKALLYASKKCRIPKIFEILLKGGAHVEYAEYSGGGDHYSESAGAPRSLHQACSKANSVAVEILVKAGAMINKGVYFGNRGMTPLHILVDQADEYIEGKEPQPARGRWKGDRLEGRQKYEERLKLAQFLLDNGAELRGIVDGGKNPVHTVCAKGMHEFLDLFLKKPNPRLEDGCFLYSAEHFENFSDAIPIHFALYNNASHIVVEKLLDANPALLNVSICSYNTTYHLKPIHLACVYGTWQQVLGLLDRGADITEHALKGEKKKWLNGLELAQKYNKQSGSMIIDTYDLWRN